MIPVVARRAYETRADNGNQTPIPYLSCVGQLPGNACVVGHHWSADGLDEHYVYRLVSETDPIEILDEVHEEDTLVNFAYRMQPWGDVVVHAYDRFHNDGPPTEGSFVRALAQAGSTLELGEPVAIPTDNPDPTLTFFDLADATATDGAVLSKQGDDPILVHRVTRNGLAITFHDEYDLEAMLDAAIVEAPVDYYVQDVIGLRHMEGDLYVLLFVWRGSGGNHSYAAAIIDVNAGAVIDDPIKFPSFNDVGWFISPHWTSKGPLNPSGSFGRFGGRWAFVGHRSENFQYEALEVLSFLAGLTGISDAQVASIPLTAPMPPQSFPSSSGRIVLPGGRSMMHLWDRFSNTRHQGRMVTWLSDHASAGSSQEITAEWDGGPYEGDARLILPARLIRLSTIAVTNFNFGNDVPNSVFGSVEWGETGYALLKLPDPEMTGRLRSKSFHFRRS